VYHCSKTGILANSCLSNSSIWLALWLTLAKELLMLTKKEQWCHRCNRYVATEVKHAKVGKLGKLAKIVVTCRKCRTTLSSKTTSASVLEKMTAETPTIEAGNAEKE